MKKCPYCAEEVQDEAKLCRWCHKELKAVVFSMGSLVRRISFLLVAVAMASFFLPFARFHFPMMGTQSFSGAAALMQAVKAARSMGQDRSDGRLAIDIPSLQKVMHTDEGLRVLQSKWQYLLIPLGIVCGVLAYVLLIFVGLGLWLRKARATARIAAACAFLTIPFAAGLLLADDLLQTTLGYALRGPSENPFARLAADLAQGIRVEPAVAVYILGAATFLIALINWKDQAASSQAQAKDNVG